MPKQRIKNYTRLPLLMRLMPYSPLLMRWRRRQTLFLPRLPPRSANANYGYSREVLLLAWAGWPRPYQEVQAGIAFSVASLRYLLFFSAWLVFVVWLLFFHHLPHPRPVASLPTLLSPSSDTFSFPSPFPSPLPSFTPTPTPVIVYTTNPLPTAAYPPSVYATALPYATPAPLHCSTWGYSYYYPALGGANCARYEHGDCNSPTAIGTPWPALLGKAVALAPSEYALYAGDYYCVSSPLSLRGCYLIADVCPACGNLVHSMRWVDFLDTSRRLSWATPISACIYTDALP